MLSTCETDSRFSDKNMLSSNTDTVLRKETCLQSLGNALKRPSCIAGHSQMLNIITFLDRSASHPLLRIDETITWGAGCPLLGTILHVRVLLMQLVHNSWSMH
jgi:hypothetical protein